MIIEVPIADVVDKYTILCIKEKRISDIPKLENVVRELQYIKQILNDALPLLSTYIEQLQEVNEKLWNIEDKLRIKESNLEFDKEFIELARGVYFTNDKRAEIKLKINYSFGSKFVEEKQYSLYNKESNQ